MENIKYKIRKNPFPPVKIFDNFKEDTWRNIVGNIRYNIQDKIGINVFFKVLYNFNTKISSKTISLIKLQIKQQIYE